MANASSPWHPQPPPTPSPTKKKILSAFGLMAFYENITLQRCFLKGGCANHSLFRCIENKGKKYRIIEARGVVLWRHKQNKIKMQFKTCRDCRRWPRSTESPSSGSRVPIAFRARHGWAGSAHNCGMHIASRMMLH